MGHAQRLDIALARVIAAHPGHRAGEMALLVRADTLAIWRDDLDAFGNRLPDDFETDMAHGPGHQKRHPAASLSARIVFCND